MARRKSNSTPADNPRTSEPIVAVDPSPVAETPEHPAVPEKQADQTSDPILHDAEVEDPPLRSARPDSLLIERLASGAGQHVPTHPDEFHPDGRPVLEETGGKDRNPDTAA